MIYRQLCFYQEYEKKILESYQITDTYIIIIAIISSNFEKTIFTILEARNCTQTDEIECGGYLLRDIKTLVWNSHIASCFFFLSGPSSWPSLNVRLYCYCYCWLLFPASRENDYLASPVCCDSVGAEK